ncbi:CdaR family protein [Lysinibacillus sp. 54212]|uniref:CdaR family protein n=1 Tax=Lysinibacillus sp. 54212 TaxID=3119829 RepID=UPI002FC99770
MDKLFDSYWVLRITALVLSLLLFFYVQSENEKKREGAAESNSTSPYVDIINDVPLEVYYDDENLIVTGLPETVDVTISGPMAIVLQEKIAKDYVVFVDLNSLLIGKHRVTIQHENFSEKLDVTIDPATIDIEIEEKVTQEFRVDPEMNNRLIDENYVLSGMTAEPTYVTVTGAKSVIESISYVKATVTGEPGINKSFEQYANVKVLNADLSRLDVRIEPEKVKVKVEINEYSKELPVVFKQKGTLQEGVTIQEISVEPTKMKVYGKKAVIDELKELVVEFDVSDLEKSGSYEAKLIVPEGVAPTTKTILIHANVKREAVDTTENETEVETEETVENQESTE